MNVYNWESSDQFTKKNVTMKLVIRCDITAENSIVMSKLTTYSTFTDLLVKLITGCFYVEVHFVFLVISGWCLFFRWGGYCFSSSAINREYYNKVMINFYIHSVKIACCFGYHDYTNSWQAIITWWNYILTCWSLSLRSQYLTTFEFTHCKTINGVLSYHYR